MAERIVGEEIERLIQLLAKVPGLGPRSARRAALQLIKKKESLLAPLAAAMADARDKVGICTACGNIDTVNPCQICNDPRRDEAALVLVSDVADLWALERAGSINARYHVLGGVLSPLDGIGPDQLNIASLVARIAKGDIKELIIALNATIEGQSTAHYVSDQVADYGLSITRLAHGVPVGGELDYLDEGTLTAAMKARTVF